MRAHGLKRVVRASRLITATDKTRSAGTNKSLIRTDEGALIEMDGPLRGCGPRPIKNRRGSECCRGDPFDPETGTPYGLPQCGHFALPSIRFFWQEGQGTRLPFGRIKR